MPVASEVVVALLRGGPSDGDEITIDPASEVITVPFLCGAECCLASYRKTKNLTDGSLEMLHVETIHRQTEAATIFIGFGWQDRLCRAFAASEKGKAFIAAALKRGEL